MRFGGCRIAFARMDFKHIDLRANTIRSCTDRLYRSFGSKYAQQWYIEMAANNKHNHKIANAKPRLAQMCSYCGCWARHSTGEHTKQKIPNIDLIIANYCCLFYNCLLLRHTMAIVVVDVDGWLWAAAQNCKLAAKHAAADYRSHFEARVSFSNFQMLNIFYRHQHANSTTCSRINTVLLHEANRGTHRKYTRYSDLSAQHTCPERALIAHMCERAFAHLSKTFSLTLK